MGEKIKSRTVSTLDKSHYCIWNPKFNLPLCYEGKVLVFTTESDAGCHESIPYGIRGTPDCRCRF